MKAKRASTWQRLRSKNSRTTASSITARAGNVWKRDHTFELCMTKDLKMKILFITTLMLSFPGTLLIAEEPWVIESPADWKKAQASAMGITVEDDTVVLDCALEGQWTSPRLWVK